MNAAFAWRWIKRLRVGLQNLRREERILLNMEDNERY